MPLTRDLLRDFLKTIYFFQFEYTEESYLFHIPGSGDEHEIMLGRRDYDKPGALIHESIHGIYKIKSFDEEGIRLDDVEEIIEETTQKFYLENKLWMDDYYFKFLEKELEKVDPLWNEKNTEANFVKRYNTIVQLYNAEVWKSNQRLEKKK